MSTQLPFLHSPPWNLGCGGPTDILSARERKKGVDECAALLDLVKPDWPFWVNSLGISEDHPCRPYGDVLVQIFGHQEFGLISLGISQRTDYVGFSNDVKNDRFWAQAVRDRR